MNLPVGQQSTNNSVLLDQGLVNLPSSNTFDQNLICGPGTINSNANDAKSPDPEKTFMATFDSGIKISQSGSTLLEP